MQGFNFAFKVKEKTLAGRTQDDLNISAIKKESQTKDDKGNTNSKVTGHDVTIRVAGIIDVGTGNNLGRDEIIDMSLLTGDEAILPIKYGPDNGEGKVYSGNAVITGYSESTAADGTATYSLDFKVAGAFTPETPEAE